MIEAPQIIVTLLRWVAGIGCAVIALQLITQIIKEGHAISKGNGQTSIWSIVSKLVTTIILLAVIVTAVGYQNILKFSERLSNSATQIVEQEFDRVDSGK